MGPTVYAQSLDTWIERARHEQAELMREKPESIPDSVIVCETRGKAEERLISAFSAISDSAFHEVWVIGKDVIPTGTCLKAAFGENVVYSNDEMDVVEKSGSVYHVHRFVISKRDGKSGKDVKDDPVKDPGTENHWEVGDETGVQINGVSYTFTCIDADRGGNALFLCNTVIPADFESEYVDEHLSPGPVSWFGETNDYMTSRIRTFLDLQDSSFMEKTVIRISESASGSTEEGKFGLTRWNGLHSYSIGYRQTTGGLFILSLDEALNYAGWLWRFNGSVTDNPKTLTGPFLSAYWLRTPYGNERDYVDSGMVYVVDLENGNIHPALVKPVSGLGDTYTDGFTAVGIRPAFMLKNN